MTTPTLPSPGAQTPDNHRAIALRFLDHAQEELDKENRLQAGEKSWGAVAHQFKTIAQERGWQHESHILFSRMARYLTNEYGLSDSTLINKVATIDKHGHRNFYENEQLPEDLQTAINNAREVVLLLEELRHRPRRPYTIRHASDQDLVEDLTGWRFDLQHRRAGGFVNLPPSGRQNRREHVHWGNHHPDDPDNPNPGGGGSRTGRPPSNPPAPAGGGTPVARPTPAPAPSTHPTVITRPALNPMTDIDTGAGMFLNAPKPPKNDILMGMLQQPSNAARSKAMVPQQPKKRRRVGGPRLPSGHRDRH